jgi:predicted ABC-type ATPase
MFAGPNGSGKSTIFNQIEEKVDFGVYLYQLNFRMHYLG